MIQMNTPPNQHTSIIAAVLSHPATAMTGRLALATPFALSGISKLLDFSGTVHEITALGLMAPTLVAAATIATQLGGSILFLTRRLCWLGAGLLSVFTLLATLVAHAFWQFDGIERVQHLRTFCEHIAIIGGFIAAAILVNTRRDPVTAGRDFGNKMGSR